MKQSADKHKEKEFSVNEGQTLDIPTGNEDWFDVYLTGNIKPPYFRIVKRKHEATHR